MIDFFFLQSSFILGAIWFVFPAYIANSSPTVLGGGPPIDGGLLWKDGKRLLGNGKTWRGLILGILCGTAIGIIQIVFEKSGGKEIVRAFLLSTGALLGDLIGSFIKRRKGLKRGESFLFMDQLGFIIVGTLMVILFFPITIQGVSFDLLGEEISYDINQIMLYLVIILPVTFIIHIAANLIWYLLGKQDVPL
ncbi:MAG: CDP-2,3-bis-(O-geranylgeranyl)-sn-glycerol synthase [Candidatus Hodarchaeales archaeon]